MEKKYKKSAVLPSYNWKIPHRGEYKFIKLATYHKIEFICKSVKIEVVYLVCPFVTLEKSFKSLKQVLCNFSKN